MRITSGQYRGRVLEGPKSDKVRPTSDKVRQAIFNILNHGAKPLDGASVLDLFCGTGALGIEALSNGADQVHFVDADTALVRKNIDKLGIGNEAQVSRKDALKFHTSQSHDFIFMDPPYHMDLAHKTLERLQSLGVMKPDSVLIVETEKEAKLPPSFKIIQEKIYGDIKVSFLEQDQ